MPARLMPEQFRGGDGGIRRRLRGAVHQRGRRDASLPVAEHLSNLRSPLLHAWQPPGGGADGALSHAVIHSLDGTVALDQPAVAPLEAVIAVLDQLTAAHGTLFGVNLTLVRLEAADTDWGWGTGETVRADSGRLVALLSGRTLPDGRALRRS